MTTRTPLQSLRRQFLSLSSSRLVAAAMQAVGFLVLSRIVTVKEVGLVALVTSVAAFAGLASDLGIGTMLSRARARRDDRLVRGGLHANHLTAAAVAVVGVGVLVTLSACSVAPLALTFLMVSLTLERHTETSLSVFFADGATAVPAQSILGRRVLSLGVFIALLLAGADGVTAFCVGQLAGNVAAVRHLVVMMRRTDGLSGERAEMRVVFKASWPFWLSGVLNQARVLDVTVVAMLVGTQLAGIYAAAQRITNPLLLIPAAVASVVLPHSTRLGRLEAARFAVRLSAQFMSLFAVVIPLALVSTRVVVLLFGEPYRASGPVLAVTLLGLPFVALAGPLTAILQSQGREQLVAVLSGVFGLLTLAGLGVGTSAFSLLGAAASVGLVAVLRCAILLGVLRGTE